MPNISLSKLQLLAAGCITCVVLTIASAVCLCGWGAISFGWLSILGFSLFILKTVAPEGYLNYFQCLLACVLLGLTFGMSDEGANWLSDFPIVELAGNLNADMGLTIRNSCVAATASTILMQFFLAYLQNRRTVYVSTVVKRSENAEKTIAILANNVHMLTVGYLMNMGKKLGFGEQAKNCERITLYVVDTPEGGKTLVNAGRYSKDPNFDTVGRIEYPSDAGFIAKAYRNGWVFEQHHSSTDTKAYVKWHKNSGLKKGTLDHLTMKSKLYCGIGIEQNNKTIGVVMIESTEHGRYTKDYLEKFFDKEKENIETFLGNIREFIAVPTQATEAGF